MEQIIYDYDEALAHLRGSRLVRRGGWWMLENAPGKFVQADLVFRLLADGRIKPDGPYVFELTEDG